MKKLLVVLSFAFMLFGMGNSLYSQGKVSYKAFMQKNPFLTTELYFNDADVVKGKIVKINKEEYNLDADGHKGFGDSEYPCISVSYYVFNDDGILDKKYSVIKDTSGVILYKKSWQYSYGKSKYTANLYDYKRDETSKVVYKVKSNGDSIELLSVDSKADSLEEIIQEEGKKEINRQKGDWDPTRSEYLYTDDSCTMKFYSGDNLLRTMNFYKGKEISYIQEQNPYTGKIISTIEFNEDFTEGVRKMQKYTDGVLSEESSTAVIVRKYNKAGFVEYESHKPYEKSEGFYSEAYMTILDSGDDFLESEF